MEYLYPRDIVQIRTESNSWVLSQSEASSMFPNIQTTWSNTLKNSESTATYSIGGNGFVFVNQDDRGNLAYLQNRFEWWGQFS